MKCCGGRTHVCREHMWAVAKAHVGMAATSATTRQQWNVVVLWTQFRSEHMWVVAKALVGMAAHTRKEDPTQSAESLAVGMLRLKWTRYYQPAKVN